MKIAYLFLPLIFFLTSANAADKSNIAKAFDIGQGRHLYLECSGSGSPTVILESGYRDNADIWSTSADKKYSVFPAVASFTRVCAYDRPGTFSWKDNLKSRSDAVSMPRSVSIMTEDLHDLLQAANIKGPYILVGHSLGGLLMRLYAIKYPNEVVGLLLIDAVPEGLRSILGPKQWESYLMLLKATPKSIEEDTTHEIVDFDEATDTVKEAATHSSLRPIPLVVIARGKIAELPIKNTDLSSENLEKSWRIGQKQLASLVPNSQLIIANESEHYIQYTQPKLVVEVIHKMVNKLRSAEKRGQVPLGAN